MRGLFRNEQYMSSVLSHNWLEVSIMLPLANSEQFLAWHQWLVSVHFWDPSRPSVQGPSPGAMCPWTDPPSWACCGSGLQYSQTSGAKASLGHASSHLPMAGLEYAAGGHDGGTLRDCWLYKRRDRNNSNDEMISNAIQRIFAFFDLGSTYISFCLAKDRKWCQTQPCVANSLLSKVYIHI